MDFTCSSRSCHPERRDLFQEKLSPARTPFAVKKRNAVRMGSSTAILVSVPASLKTPAGCPHRISSSRHFLYVDRSSRPTANQAMRTVADPCATGSVKPASAAPPAHPKILNPILQLHSTGDLLVRESALHLLGKVTEKFVRQFFSRTED